jgi:hypothetical protein
MVGTKLPWKNERRLTIMTAYRSPRQQPNGGFGFYDQQHAMLIAAGVKKPNVRKQFVLDIIQFIQQLQSAGHEIDFRSTLMKPQWIPPTNTELILSSSPVT